jgi:hypothetical protein
MDTATAIDVADLIASVEMHRREMERSSGFTAACNEALRLLHELLDLEREALQMHGPGIRRHSANIGVVTTEITRVEQMLGNTSRGPIFGNPPPARHHASPQSAARNFHLNKSRKTMGQGER